MCVHVFMLQIVCACVHVANSLCECVCACVHVANSLCVCACVHVANSLCACVCVCVHVANSLSQKADNVYHTWNSGSMLRLPDCKTVAVCQAFLYSVLRTLWMMYRYNERRWTRGKITVQEMREKQFRLICNLYTCQKTGYKMDIT